MTSSNTNIRPTALIILDGWGHRINATGNAILQAKSQFFYDTLLKKFPHTFIHASSNQVGLPNDIMGNSEVGHMTIGAGRKIMQDLVRIDESFKAKTFSKNDVFDKLVTQFKNNNNSNLHLMGLVSDGCVHSNEYHYIELLQCLKQADVDMSKVKFHAILDGRDTAPQSAKQYLKTLIDALNDVGADLLSMSGRFYAMDRDSRWERLEKSWKAIAGKKCDGFSCPFEALEKSYQNNVNDEFFIPVKNAQCAENNFLKNDDFVLCFNYRSDRMRQLCHLMLKPEQQNIKLKDESMAPIKNLKLYTMTSYDETFDCNVFFEKESVRNCLGQVICDNHLKQFRVAETEKYAHVTFFLNGGQEQAFIGERRSLIPSPKVKSYDEMPAMHSQQITHDIVTAIEARQEHLIVANYAQPDMVGHTGNFDAALEAVNATNICLEKIMQACFENDYQLLITSDHGNIEQMQDDKGNIHTSHTCNLVPFVWVNKKHYESASIHNQFLETAKQASLANIAPTLLNIMGLNVPSDMTAKALFNE